MLLKQAGMEKIIESLGDYRPFNTGDSWKGSLVGGLGGAGLGALLGGGGALVSDLITDEEEKKRDTALNMLKGTLGGAAIGGGIGAVSPQIPPALLPHLSRFLGESKKVRWDKDHGDKGILGKMKHMDELAEAKFTEPGMNNLMPELSFRDIKNLIGGADNNEAFYDKIHEVGRRTSHGIKEQIEEQKNRPMGHAPGS